MTIKHRLQKLEQQTAQTCPRPYATMSPEERKERILQLVQERGYSEEELQRLIGEAKRRARARSLQS